MSGASRDDSLSVARRTQGAATLSTRPLAERRALARLLAATPARLAIGRTGPRLPVGAYLRFLADHARARDAVTTEVPPAFVRRSGLIELATRAATREAFVAEPALGRVLAPSAQARLRRCRRRPTVQLALADGLSSTAIVANGGVLLRALTRLLRARRRRLGTPLFVRNARVRVQDEIGEIVRPEVCCLLVGERPGLATAESVSAYVIYRPRRRSSEPDRTVVSNIHRGGLPPAAAARRLADLIDTILARRASGAALASAGETETTAASAATPRPRSRRTPRARAKSRRVPHARPRSRRPARPRAPRRGARARRRR